MNQFQTHCFLSVLVAVFLPCDLTAAIVPGHVEGWGDNFSGQATPPPGLTDVIAITAGFSHSLALRADGTVVAWGRNAEGQAGVPPGLSNVVAIAARAHNVALKADGTVIAWGHPAAVVTNVPPGLNDVIAISAGGSANGNVFTLALRRNGTIAAWGNSQGDLEFPRGLSNLVQISAGYIHSLARKSDGTLVGWGYNNFDVTNAPPGVSDLIDVAAGQSTSLAVLRNGTVVKWGGTFDSNDVPASVTGVIDVEVGFQHVLALRTNGTVLAWGAPFAGFVPEGINGVSAIAAGGNHNLVLTARPLISSITPPVQATVGSAVTLTVSALGEPLSYRWQRFGTNLPGQTNASLIINRVEPADGGPYHVILTNPHGTNVASTAVSFPPPVVITQPQALTVYRGQTVTFTAAASGLAPFIWQWFRQTNTIPGATNASLTFIPLNQSDSGSYHVVATDVASGSSTSSDAVLTVNDPRKTNFFFTPILDTSIHSSGGNPQGVNTILSGLRRNGARDRGLLRFDLTSLPAGTQIESASVRLTVVRAPRGGGTESNFRLHRVLRPWTAEATWQEAATGTAWSTPGGAPEVDYSASGLPLSDVVADVTTWIHNPATNHGWAVISDAESVPGTARHFGSSESANPPQLEVHFLVNAPIPTITGTTIQSSNLTFQITGAPGWIYYIQTREQVDDGIWTTITNVPAGAALTPILISLPLTNRYQFFRALRD